MVTVRLETWINAPVERCFKLVTSHYFHRVLSESLANKAVASTKAKGSRLQVGDTLVWHGSKMGVNLRYTTRIDALRIDMYLREVLESGPFRRFEHEQHFAPMDDGTRLRDEVRFEAPIMLEGVLRRHLIVQLKLRAHTLKWTAESAEWRQYLPLHEPAESSQLAGHRDPA